MKFNEAFAIATQESPVIRHASEVVDNAIKNSTSSPCYTFSLGDEAFSFGFDGVDMHKVKHTAKRSAVLIHRGDTFVVKP